MCVHIYTYSHVFIQSGRSRTAPFSGLDHNTYITPCMHVCVCMHTYIQICMYMHIVTEVGDRVNHNELYVYHTIHACMRVFIYRVNPIYNTMHPCVCIYVYICICICIRLCIATQAEDRDPAAVDVPARAIRFPGTLSDIHTK